MNNVINDSTLNHEYLILDKKILDAESALLPHLNNEGKKAFLKYESLVEKQNNLFLKLITENQNL